MTEKEFLKRFTQESKDFGENVISEIEAFSKDMEVRSQHVKELKGLACLKQKEVEAKLKLIERKQKETLEQNLLIINNNSKI